MQRLKQNLHSWNTYAVKFGLIFVLSQVWISKLEGAATVPPLQPTCIFSSATGSTDCQSRGINNLRDILEGDVPNVPKETTILLLGDNPFNDVPGFIFRNLTNLTLLYMQSNTTIQRIEEFAFEGLFKLISLSIKSSVENIYRNTFVGLRSLTNLTLGTVQYIAPDAFINTPRLSSLVLTMNCIPPAFAVYTFLQQRHSQSHIIDSIHCTQGGSLRQAVEALNVNLELPFSNNCYTCTNVSLANSCLSQRCATAFSSCSDLIATTGRGISITKECINLDACMTRTAEINPASSQNHSCCLGDNCNRQGLIEMSLARQTYIVHILFTHDISSSSRAYWNLWTIFQTKLQKVLYEVMPRIHEVEVTSVMPSPVVGFNGTVSYVRIRTTVSSISNESVTRMNISNAISTAKKNNQFMDVALNGMYFKDGSLGVCLHSIDSSNKGNYTWQDRWINLTTITRSFSLPCRYNLGNLPATAVRQCTLDIPTGIVYWLPPNHDNCMTAQRKVLLDLNDTKVDQDNVEEISGSLRNATSSEELSEGEVEIATGLLDRILALNSTHVARVAHDVVHTQSNLLGSGQDSLLKSETNSQSVNRILRGIDTFAEKVDISGTNLTIVAPNLAVSVVSANASDPEFSGLGFDSVSSGRNTNENVVRLVGSENEPVPDVADVGIRLPRTLFIGLNVTQQASASRVHFVVYQQNTFFKVLASVSNSPGSVKTNTSVYPYVDINGHIIAGSVVGLTVQNLADPVTISFKHLEREKETVNNSQCVFWDFSANSGQGGWSGRGCRLAGDQPGNRTVCHCDHLTNFALLVDVFGSGSAIDPLNRRILMIVTYVGCGLSVLGLLLTIISYLAYMKLRKDTPSKILIQLCFALLGLNVVYVTGTQDLRNLFVCKTVAILLHYFLLATLMWMLIEAFYMYLALVKVFQTYYRKLLLKFAIVGWGVPLVIVAITLAINIDNYNYYTGYEEAFCWLTVIPMYVTVITPVAVTVVINFVAFGLVFHQVRSHVQQKKITKTQKASSVSQVRGALGIMALLGLTWVFAFFTFSAKFIVFHYLFAIFNSLQGLFVFIFHCFLKHDVRMMWMRSLPCCPKPKDSSTFNSSSKVPNRVSTEMTTTSSRNNSFHSMSVGEVNVQVPLNNAYQTSKGKIY